VSGEEGGVQTTPKCVVSEGEGRDGERAKENCGRKRTAIEQSTKSEIVATLKRRTIGGRANTGRQGKRLRPQR